VPAVLRSARPQRSPPAPPGRRLTRQADPRSQHRLAGLERGCRAASDGGEDEREPRSACSGRAQDRRPRSAGRAGSRASRRRRLHHHLRHLGHYVNARFLFKHLAFDVLKDFAPISLAVSSPSYVAVHVSVPVNSLQELIDYAKRNPGKLEYSSSGVGSVFHLAGESLKLYAGIDLLHVPYAQANFPQMVNDWASGRVALWFPTYAFLVPNMPKVRPLAIVDNQRSARMPDIPTVAETLPNFRGFPAWWAFFGPTGLPAPIAERLSGEVRAALKQPEVVAKLAIWDSPPSKHARRARGAPQARNRRRWDLGQGDRARAE